MTNWWNYLDETEYRKWRAEEWGREARQEATRRQAALAPLPESEEEVGGPGGILGGLQKIGGGLQRGFELTTAMPGLAIGAAQMVPTIFKAGFGGDEEARRRLMGQTLAGAGKKPEEVLPKWRPYMEETGPTTLTGMLMGRRTPRDVYEAARREYEAAPLPAQLAAHAVDPTMLIGLGGAARGARALGLGAKATGAAARAEDILVGGSLFRAAGRAVTGPGRAAGRAMMAPFKAATRRLAPDVPKTAGIRAKATDLKIWQQQDDAAKKLTDAISGSIRPAREETEALYTAKKAEQAARLGKIPTEIGEEALKEQRRILKGPLPKAELEPLKMTGNDIRHLYNRINQADIPEFERVAARETLAKLLDPTAPTIPGLKEIARLEKLFGPELPGALRGLNTLSQKAYAAAVDAINLPRAVLASYDLSALLRQGLLLLFAKPKSWAIGAIRGLRWMFDPQYTVDRWNWYLKPAKGTEVHAQQAFIANRARGKLLTEPGGVIGATEEMYGSGLARQLPGLPMSERVYVGTLNEMRWDALFNEIAQRERQIGRTLNLTGKGEGAATDLRFLDDMVEALGPMTGRGNLPEFLTKYEGLLGAMLFAPRLLWARVSLPFQMIKNENARWMIARGYAGAATATVGMLSMAKLAGLPVEIDPRSTDFGKLRVDRTRIDLLGGYQPLIRYTAQLLSGERKTTVAGEVYGIDRFGVMETFLRTKLSPVLGVATDVWSGKTMLGDPMTGDIIEEGEFWNQFKQRIVPMFVQDFEEAIREQGGLKGAVLAAPGGFGASVMSYAWPAQKMDEHARRVMGQGWKDLNTLERRQLLEKSPEAYKDYEEYIEMGVRRGQDWAEGLWETMESNRELEARLVEALNAGASKAEVAADFNDYRDSVQYEGDPDREARDEDEALIMGYFGIKKEDFRRPDGTTDFGAFYDARRQYAEGSPRTQEWFNENELLKWTDPVMKGFVSEWQRANDLWGQYYQIPTKIGMSEEEQEEAQEVAGMITSLQFMNPGMPMQQALMQLPITPHQKMLYLRYVRLPSNPERERFRRQYGEEMALIKPPQFGAALPTEMAQ